MLDLSPNAIRILEARYLRRDATGAVAETPDELFRRVARAVTHAEAAFGMPHAAEKSEASYDLLASLDFLPSSPALMNAGTPLGS